MTNNEKLANEFFDMLDEYIGAAIDASNSPSTENNIQFERIRTASIITMAEWLAKRDK